MTIHLERIEDKIECYEETSMEALEKKINDQVDVNKVLMLEVNRVDYQIYQHPKSGAPIYTAIVHFKAKRA
ncbi:DUF2536 family protein [Halalkalibacter urbisdiaboli]|uniref:DUF2536 family protein n=1 Tax=Halalkalibacter urbisdiaboli TaxID=1960589 RepID=UPI000B435085|nr:DUF2536 family protein [Halalkalibacter urbisdiaboli]